MKFIDRYRQDKEDQFVDNAVIVTFENICDYAAQMPSADSYEIRYATRMPSLKAAEKVLESVRLKFLAEDVKADLFYMEGMICGKIASIAPPSQEVYQLRMFWSRAPGKFINKLTGNPIDLTSSLSMGPVFTGTVREWYETLIETIVDASNELRKQHGVTPNKIYVGPNVRCILEACVMYRPSFPGGLQHYGTLAGGFKIYETNRLTNDVEVCLDLGDERHIAIVSVLDMNII